jgi:hypothetical protein
MKFLGVRCPDCKEWHLLSELKPINDQETTLGCPKGSTGSFAIVLEFTPRSLKHFREEEELMRELAAKNEMPRTAVKEGSSMNPGDHVKVVSGRRTGTKGRIERIREGDGHFVIELDIPIERKILIKTATVSPDAVVLDC